MELRNQIVIYMSKDGKAGAMKANIEEIRKLMSKIHKRK